MTPEQIRERVIFGTGRLGFPRGSRGSFPSMRRQRGFVGPVPKPRPTVKPPKLPVRKPTPLRRGRPVVEPFPRPWEVQAPELPPPLPQAKPRRIVLDPADFPTPSTMPAGVPLPPSFPRPQIPAPTLPPQETPDVVRPTRRAASAPQTSPALPGLDPFDLLRRLLRQPSRFDPRTAFRPADVVRPAPFAPPVMPQPSLPVPDLTDPQVQPVPFAPPAPYDPCAAQVQQAQQQRRRQRQRRKCAVRYNVAWTSGPNKGEVAGSRCFSFEKAAKRAATKFVRELF